MQLFIRRPNRGHDGPETVPQKNHEKAGTPVWKVLDPSMKATALLTLIFLSAASLRLPALTNTTATNGGYVPLTGQEVFPEQGSLLMQELGKTGHSESQTRRFEIVFFVSLPVTLMLAYSLMEGLARNTYDRNNPDRTIQQPHYIYMFSTSVLTSLYIAIEDARRHTVSERPKPTDVSEIRLEFPVVGVRF